jgi:hypothetical protein
MQEDKCPGMGGSYVLGLFTYDWHSVVRLSFLEGDRTFTGDDTSWCDLKKIQKIDLMLTAMTKDQRREWLANNME